MLSHFFPSLIPWSLRLTVAPEDVLQRLLILIAWLIINAYPLKPKIVFFVQFFRRLKTVWKGHLTPDDYHAATTGIVRIVEHSPYSQEIKDIKSKGNVKPSSKIRICILYLMAMAFWELFLPAAINPTIQIILQRITSMATRTMIRHTHELSGHLGHIISKVR